VFSYISEHGGGTLAVSSQSTAASAIIEGHTNVAGIGGFSGRESDVSLSWLAQQVRTGKIRWVLDEGSGAGGFGGGGGLVSARLAAAGLGRGGLAGGAGGFGRGSRGGPPRETRIGSKTAMAAVAKACVAVTLPTSATTTGSRSRGAASASTGTLYDCEGRASELAAA
jgi:hypothetical protein